MFFPILFSFFHINMAICIIKGKKINATPSLFGLFCDIHIVHDNCEIRIISSSLSAYMFRTETSTPFLVTVEKLPKIVYVFGYHLIQCQIFVLSLYFITYLKWNEKKNIWIVYNVNWKLFISFTFYFYFFCCAIT